VRKLPTITTTHFGDALREARKASQHTIKSLAIAVGCSEGTITSWETADKRPPAADVVTALAAACGADPVPLYIGAARDTGELRFPATTTEDVVIRVIAGLRGDA
jgi:transcriptional regulator with XRE-family HTH domain